NAELTATDETIWKSGSPDSVKALDEVFMADFGSNLGYPIKLVPLTETDSIYVSESGDSLGSTDSASSIRSGVAIKALKVEEEFPPERGYSLKLPAEICSSDIPCTGLIVAELDIQWPKVNCRSPRSKYATNYKFDQVILKASDPFMSTNK
ncbi:hypothetical protein Ciccas_011167, partial [Cichlidogyrus casuarinus]